jgi:glutathione S-transferase
MSTFMRASSLLPPSRTIHRYNFSMSIDVYWAVGCPFSWRVLLTLELKGLAWNSHAVHLDLQEQKSPRMLAMNPRGRVPVLRDGDYVVFESLATMYYIDLKYPDPPIFGRSPEEAGVIMRVINEFQAYTEAGLLRIIESVQRPRPAPHEALTHAMHLVAAEARTIESRLAKGDWIVGEAVSAADLAIYPCISLLHRALMRPEARELSTRFLPAEVHYPRLAQWMQRIEGLPGYQRTASVNEK